MSLIVEMRTTSRDPAANGEVTVSLDTILYIELTVHSGESQLTWHDPFKGPHSLQ